MGFHSSLWLQLEITHTCLYLNHLWAVKMQYLNNDQRASTKDLTPLCNIYSTPGIIIPALQQRLVLAPLLLQSPLRFFHLPPYHFIKFLMSVQVQMMPCFLDYYHPRVSTLFLLLPRSRRS
jgi:hypothetical protein